MSGRRVNIALRPPVETDLSTVMDREGLDMTAAINILIRRGAYLSGFMNDPDARIYVERNGKTTEIVIL